MIIIKGDIKKGIEISFWLKSQGLTHDKDYTWHTKSRTREHPYDCVVFAVKDSKWESAIALRYL